MHYFQKQPWEQYYVSIQFLGRLPADAALASGTVSAIDTTDADSDATALVLDDPDAVIDATQAQFFVKGGITQHVYKISLRVELSPGSPVSKLEEEVFMAVEEL